MATKKRYPPKIHEMPIPEKWSEEIMMRQRTFIKVNKRTHVEEGDLLCLVVCEDTITPVEPPSWIWLEAGTILRESKFQIVSLKPEISGPAMLHLTRGSRKPNIITLESVKEKYR